MNGKLHKSIGLAVKNAEQNTPNDLVTKNLKYVVLIANKYAKVSNFDLDDLISEGTIGLVKAAENYREEKNDAFLGFAKPYIEGYCKNFINLTKNKIHVPAYKLATETTVCDSIDRRESEYGEQYGYDEPEIFDNPKNDYEGIILNTIPKILTKNEQTALKIKLRLGEYEAIKTNSMGFIAEQLKTTPYKANKIYNEAFEKVSKYFQSENN